MLDPAFDEQMYQCLNCRACEAVCPSGVQYGPLVEASRAQIEQHRPRPVQQELLRSATLGWLFGDVRRIRAFTRADRALPAIRSLHPSRGRQACCACSIWRDAEAMLPPIKSRPLQPGNRILDTDCSSEACRAVQRLHHGHGLCRCESARPAA